MAEYDRGVFFCVAGGVCSSIRITSFRTARNHLVGKDNKGEGYERDFKIGFACSCSDGIGTGSRVGFQDLQLSRGIIHQGPSFCQGYFACFAQ